MKTTNLFIDFLIIGALVYVAFASACYFAGYCELFNPIVMETKDKEFILPLATVLTYATGILFNQISDNFLKITKNFLRLTKIDSTENELGEKLGVSYHEALQKIIKDSQQAYDFLSYRRSIIRIFRTLFTLSLLSPVFCLVLILIDKYYDKPIVFVPVVYFILLSICLEEFSRRRYIKLQVGYY